MKPRAGFLGQFRVIFIMQIFGLVKINKKDLSELFKTEKMFEM